MKRKNIFRLLGLIAALSIVLMTLPALPVYAATCTVSPSTAKVGQTVTYTCTGFGTSVQDDDYYIDIYLSDQAATAGQAVGTQVTRFKKVIYGSGLDVTGATSGTFVMPATLDEGLGATTPLTLVAGTTYYVYATQRYGAAFAATPNVNIAVVTTMGVTPGATLDPLSPATGPAGTVVSVSGGNFPANTALVLKLDGTTITPASGDTSTRASGIFISTITIPVGTAAGAHTITVTAGSSTATATFTVTAPATLTLSPTTGAAGSQVAMTGTGFPAGTISVNFDTTPTPITGGSTSTSGGTFASFINIPTTATAGSHAITVSIVGTTTTASANFIVTALAALTLSPASGPAGTVVSVSGGNFPISTALVLKLDGTTITPTSGDTSTRASGIFISTITIPQGTAAGAHTIKVTAGSTMATTTFMVTAPNLEELLKRIEVLEAKVAYLMEQINHATDQNRPENHDRSGDRDQPWDGNRR